MHKQNNTSTEYGVQNLTPKGQSCCGGKDYLYNLWPLGGIG